MSKQMYKWEENGQELKDYIVSVFRASLNNENLKNFKIEKNHIEIGQGGFEYKFDVFYEVKLAKIYLKAAIECKYYNKRITKEMVKHFKEDLNECNNITGFILATKSYNVEAKKYADFHGIQLITDDQLPNVPGMLLLQTACSVPDENVHGDPFWTIMKVTKYGKNTGSYYSLNGNEFNMLEIVVHKRYRSILLFISKKSAERVLEADGAKDCSVFGVSRQQLRWICLLSQFFKCELLISSVLSLDSYGNSLVFKHSYDELLAEYDLE
ncbi:hypothetical protein EO98_08625 [Methanosarcina sp. 2.H.T.1A.6]|uniref:restriction endonuclease n=1 Tax=unclassified Methanosarcina TaxID=2644672 RepID=UPI0006210088|nr:MULTISPECIES: restriction endonuclease [unclassified Methanosarcina]KKG15312.1 hypothetical protein EO94_10480 [Methanosarcina sp. 2.H.T.1A.3]KKG20151.1 hypothetical protein EO98_08625 [Methanosarcina sp. 2.H.T.1A.6]KKG23569.1 hypothetical protein EO96_08685 [Methanosarcina sp. 2.H.T.1A.8]KKG25316.1 hypothetical protein EO97_07490 [Methanosarcina sp. 2.H.T.1A.15]